VHDRIRAQEERVQKPKKHTSNQERLDGWVGFGRGGGTNAIERKKEGPDIGRRGGWVILVGGFGSQRCR